MEKERYTIEQFELDEPNCIFDNKTQNVIFTLSGYHYDELSSLMNLLNQQDARIKVLEDMVIDRIGKLYSRLNEINDLQKENQQLKQSQNQKAIEVLEKVKNYFVEECEDADGIKTGDRVITKDTIEVADFVNNQIKELG